MSSTTSQTGGSSDNFVTVARALDGKRLNKTIYSNGTVIPYDNAYKFAFRNMPISTLQELYVIAKQFLSKPKCCFLRAIAIDDTVMRQRRLLNEDKKNGDKPTLIERATNWFALDVDDFGKSTGNLKEDATNVLLALDLSHIECFAVASASYQLKPGIRIRLFLWNDEPITSLTLKKYFKSCDDIVDLAMFSPIQPIYIARPTFIGMDDPVKQQIVWITGRSQTTHIQEMGRYGITDREEDRYLKPEAERILKAVFRELETTPQTKRHDKLINLAILVAKLCAQGHFDADEMKDELEAFVYECWKGNAKKDRECIEYAFQVGTEAMEQENATV